MIDVVVVNWNSGELLAKCLASVARYGIKYVSKIVVVDNGSSDDSLNHLEAFDLPLVIISNNANLGFAQACNQGAAVCNAEYILFLNPDTEIFENSLDIPLAYMNDKANYDVGICGIQLVDEGGYVTHSCAYFPTLSRFVFQAVGLTRVPGLKGAGIHMNDWDHLSDKTVNHVMGAFFFMRRTVFEALKGFDERFFVYLEDVDFSLRARQAGWKTTYLTGVQAFHHGGGVSRQIKATRLFYSLRSRLLYGFKHFFIVQAWILLGVTIFVEPLSRLVFAVFKNEVQDMQNTLAGYRMLYREIPNIISNKDRGAEV